MRILSCQKLARNMAWIALVFSALPVLAQLQSEVRTASGNVQLRQLITARLLEDRIVHGANMLRLLL